MFTPKAYTPQLPIASNTLPKSKPKQQDNGFHVSADELKRVKSKEESDGKGPYVLIQLKILMKNFIYFALKPMCLLFLNCDFSFNY